MREKGARLTPGEVEAFKAAVKAGKPDWQVARETGVSVTTVRRRRLAMGIKRREGRAVLTQETVDSIRRLTMGGKTVVEISDELGIGLETARRYRKMFEAGMIPTGKQSSIPVYLWQEWEDTVNTIRAACGRKPLGDGR